MPYFVVDDFKAGVDLTQPAFAAPAGSLRAAVNCHITRGGHVEKRKAFVSKYTLPAGTFGLAQAAGALYVFGSAVPPPVPTGVNYVRCTHPDGEAMTRVLQTELFNGKLYVAAEFADGSTHHFYDGTRVEDWYDGRARGSFDVTGGTASAGINKVTSVTVDGIEVLDTDVDWTTSHTATAAAIAAQINSHASSPEYTATSVGTTVYVLAPADDGADANGREVVVTVAGNVTVSTPTDLSGGVTSDTTFTPGSALRTLKGKLYSTSGSNLHFSEINVPTHWQSTYDGAGAVDLSNESAGSEELIGLATYYRSLAIFARNGYQVWSVASDPLENSALQVTPGLGLVATRAVTTNVDGNVVFLSEIGVRALVPRDSSNLAVVDEMGVAIDDEVIAHMADLTETELAAALTFVEPRDKRLWVVLGERVFVHTQFPSRRIRAWSEYQPGFQITDHAIARNELYVRSGDTIYLYGGDSGVEYGDDYEVRVRIPYVASRAPATFKNLQGLDLGVEGEWTATVLPGLSDEEEGEVLGTVTEPTFDKPAIDASGYSSHFGIELTHQGDGYARFSIIVLHFAQADAA